MLTTLTTAEVMNHTSIKARLTDTTSSFLPYIRKNYPKIDVVLAEAGLELDHSGGLKNNLERTLGAALWQVDWMLTGITMVRPSHQYLPLTTQFL